MLYQLSGNYGNLYLNTFTFFLPEGEYTTQETAIDCSDYHTYINIDETKPYLALIMSCLNEYDIPYLHFLKFFFVFLYNLFHILGLDL
mgnify:CR=1 FL=1